MIRFSDISGNPVMDTSTATTVGKVQAPIVDPVVQQVVGFRVRKSKGPGDVLLWSSVAGLGPDALTVDSSERLAEPPEQLKHRSNSKLDLIGRKVLTENGHELGKVKDVEFDPADGRVTSLMLKDSFVDGERLLGIGSFAVVVSG
jgi:sporulation protein YlmC with PRC-barrel domain